MEIKYEFVTGEVLEIEVEDALGEVLLEFDRRERNNDRRETRRHMSLDGMDFEGEWFVSSEDTEGAALCQEDMGRLARALEMLSPEQRELVLTVYFKGALVNKNWTLKLYFLTYNLYYFTAAYVSLYCLGVKYPREYAGRSSLKNFIYAAISSSIFSPCR